MTIYDFIVIGIIAIFALVGLKKGLVMMVLRLVSWVASYIFAKTASPIAADYFTRTQYYISFTEFIKTKLINFQATSTQNLEQSLQSASSGTSNGIIGDLLIEGLKQGQVIDTSNVLAFVSMAMANMLVRVGFLIIIFILVRFIFSLIMIIAKVVVSLPAIKQFDKLGGLGLGLLEGSLLTYIIVTIVSTMNFGGIRADFQKSLIVKSFIGLNQVDSQSEIEGEKMDGQNAGLQKTYVEKNK